MKFKVGQIVMIITRKETLGLAIIKQIRQNSYEETVFEIHTFFETPYGLDHWKPGSGIFTETSEIYHRSKVLA